METKQLNIPLPRTLKTRLDNYCRDNGIHQKEFVRLAIEKMLAGKPVIR